MEEIFPHVELLYCELRNMNFELDDEMSEVSLLVSKPSLPDKMFSVFSCDSLSTDKDNLSIQMLYFLFKAKQRLFQSDIHEIY